jgi:glyoxylase-like metal-dependent hydrolase (beta-lactamase superfamily II)
VNVSTIDCLYCQNEKHSSSYLVTQNEKAIFVDNNTANSVEILLHALKDQGIEKSDVDYLFVTHIHLDHAGGTSALLKHLPNARVVCHPRAQRHLVDPTKLVQSAKSVYGEEHFHKMYGEIGPIDVEKITIVEDNETLSWGDETIHFLHTRGHAKHHICFYFEKLSSVFTGDSFGLFYPTLQRNHSFVFPSTSPTDFEPDHALITIKRIIDTTATSIYPTHFGKIPDNQKAYAHLKSYLEFASKLLTEQITTNLVGDALYIHYKDHITEYFKKCFADLNISWNTTSIKWMSLDIDLNAQGMAFSTIRLRKPLK